MAPKYLLSFSCLSFPTGYVRTTKRPDSDTLDQVFITSKENSMVVDVPDSEYVQEGSLLLGVWIDQLVYLRYEATQAIHNVKTAYPKPQMISQKFQEGQSLVIFEVNAPPNDQNTNLDTQSATISQFDPLVGDNSIPSQEQSEKDTNKDFSISGFEDQSIQPLDTSPAKLDGPLENDSFETQDPIPNLTQTDENQSQKTNHNSVVNKPEIHQIELALDSSAVTYAIMLRNQLKKSKLHNISQNFDLPYQTAKWFVRAPCSGLITSKMITPTTKKITQGTTFASIQCISKKNRKKANNEFKNKEIPLIMPFSIKINRIKAEFKETDELGLYSAMVSKNQSILSGKLIQESKNIPAHILYGKFQLLTAPCTGTLRNIPKIGKSVKKRDSLFSVECLETGKDSLMNGLTTKPGLVTKVFRENQENVKVSSY